MAMTDTYTQTLVDSTFSALDAIYDDPKTEEEARLAIMQGVMRRGIDYAGVLMERLSQATNSAPAPSLRSVPPAPPATNPTPSAKKRARHSTGASIPQRRLSRGKLWGTQQVADFLRISDTQVLKMMWAKKLPAAAQQGRQFLFDPAALRAQLSLHPKTTLVNTKDIVEMVRQQYGTTPSTSQVGDYLLRRGVQKALPATWGDMRVFRKSDVKPHLAALR